MSEYVSETRFKLDEARFFYEQMRLSLQDRTKFLYFLDAFLSTARAVTWVFQKARGKVEESLMVWYDTTITEWKGNEIMRFFIEMRNISVKEHTPKMQTTAAVDFHITVTIGESLAIKKVSPDGSVQQVASSSPKTTEESDKKQQTASTTARIVSYSFFELPKGFSEDPDVIALCGKYLDMLEAFVTEAESKVSIIDRSHFSK